VEALPFLDVDNPAPKAPSVNTAHWGEEGGDYSSDGRYRWSYSRVIGDGPTICWIGLNPGTGDSDGKSRPTLQRMVNRSLALGMGRFVLVNLFAWRGTDPKELRLAHKAGNDIVGPNCDQAIAEAAEEAACVVTAWGSHGALADRGATVLATLGEVQCLGTTTKGLPRHPLYVRAGQELVPLVNRARSRKR
jgi:hypothetical protein